MTKLTNMVLIGAGSFIAGMLLAPKSGKETRRDLMDKANEYKDKANDGIEQMKKSANSAKDDLAEGVESMKDTAKDAVKSVKRTIRQNDETIDRKI